MKTIKKALDKLMHKTTSPTSYDLRPTREWKTKGAFIGKSPFKK